MYFVTADPNGTVNKKSSNIRLVKNERAAILYITDPGNRAYYNNREKWYHINRFRDSR